MDFYLFGTLDNSKERFHNRRPSEINFDNLIPEILIFVQLVCYEGERVEMLVTVLNLQKLIHKDMLFQIRFGTADLICVLENKTTILCVSQRGTSLA